MSKLELFSLDDDTWAALYDGEEAHNIQGDSIEDKLKSAATVWGLDLEHTEIEVLGMPWWENDNDH